MARAAVARTWGVCGAAPAVSVPVGLRAGQGNRAQAGGKGRGAIEELVTGGCPPHLWQRVHE